jgi:MFS family permease
MNSKVDFENAPEESKIKREVLIEDIYEEIGFGNFQVHLILVIGATIACDSIEGSIVAFLQECIKDDMNLDGNYEALLSSAVFVGQILGMLCSPAADIFGRKIVIYIGWAFIVVFGIASTWSPNYWSLVLMRSLVGYGIGISQTTSKYFFSALKYNSSSVLNSVASSDVQTAYLYNLTFG